MVIENECAPDPLKEHQYKKLLHVKNDANFHLTFNSPDDDGDD